MTNLAKLAEELILSEELSQIGLCGREDELAALVGAASVLAWDPRSPEFIVVCKTIFQLGVQVGREDARLDMFRDE